MGRDTGKFTADHANGLATRGQLPAHELFNGTGVSNVVGKWGEVIKAVGIRHKLVVVHALRNLLITTVKVADVRVTLGDDFAVELKNEAQHTVCGWVRWAHIQHHLFAEYILGFRLIVRVEPSLCFSCGVGCLVFR